MEDSDFRTVKLVPQGVTLNGPASSPGSSRFRIFENENTLGRGWQVYYIISFLSTVTLRRLPSSKDVFCIT